MPSPATLRRRRSKLDEAVARAFTPLIRRVMKREEARVKAAKTQRQMIAAVRTSDWVSALVTAWLSEPVMNIWKEQQTALGLELPMPKEIRKKLGQIGADHGTAIAETRRDRIRSRFG